MDGTVYGILTCPTQTHTPKSRCPVPSYSPMGWTGLSQIPVSRPISESHGMDRTVHGILMGSHTDVYPSNPSVPSHPTVPWDGWDCPWDSNVSHPDVYSQIPVSRPIPQPHGMDRTVHGILTGSHTDVYPQIPVSRPIPQSHGMDGTVHGVLTCPTQMHTPKSRCPVPSHSPIPSHSPMG